MNSKKFLLEQLKLEDAFKNYAVVSIIRTDGTVSRKSGKMLVLEDGTHIGTIGGGSAEHKAIKDATECIRCGKNTCIDYTLNSENKEIGMVCGGNLSVFIEVQKARPQLFLCGAGHVGKALMRIAHLVNFEITLIDTREKDQISDALPLADTFIPISDFYQDFLNLEIPDDAYIVVTTFSHHHDKEALRAALTKNAAYIGMIGSRKKIVAIFEKLRSEGISDQQLDSVYSPIGIDIGGETPDEIALSIMAEILSVKYKKPGGHLINKED
ncbi:MAG: XdhC/CoxI family protein [Eubacterium sp.]